MNPYQILDIDLKASDREIKKAYHKMAKNTHPDNGGTEEEFKQVNTAYKTLIDPERRKRYDQTGDVDEQESPVEQLVVNIYNAVLLGVIEEGRDPEKVNLLDLVKKEIHTTIIQLEKQVVENLRRVVKLKKVAERFTSKGDNILSKATLVPVANLEQQVADDKRRIELVKKAYDIVNQHNYKFDTTKSPFEPSYEPYGMWMPGQGS